jgi:hypothetical protein
MKLSALLLLLLVSCYDGDDAAEQAIKTGATKPVKCVARSGGWNTNADYQDRTYVCVDARQHVWSCAEDDGCLNTGHQ